MPIADETEIWKIGWLMLEEKEKQGSGEKANRQPSVQTEAESQIY